MGHVIALSARPKMCRNKRLSESKEAGRAKGGESDGGEGGWILGKKKILGRRLRQRDLGESRRAGRVVTMVRGP